MAYLNSVYAADPNKGFLYKITNDTIETRFTTGTNPSGICVSTDKTTVLVTNMDDNTVTVYRNDSRVKDIAVGTHPWSICQGVPRNGDPGIPYFVTNYTDGTVTKIYVTSTGAVSEGKTYRVGLGPRGICCDPDGNIYVANYLDNTVSVIGYKTDLVGESLDVSINPNALCSDATGNIYVACSSAGLVAKITKDSKVEDIIVGRLPYAVCCDKSNNIWVTNYNSNTVTKITASGATSTYDVGTSPIAVDTDNEGNIWVFNHDSKNISKLNSDGTVVDVIPCDYNPTGNGDFTGMQANFIIGNASDYNPDGTKKIGWEDLDSNLQNIINHMVLPENILASNVTLEGHAAYGTVQAALDALLYNKPSIISFEVTPSIVQLGSRLTSLDFKWQIPADTDSYVTKQVITDAAGRVVEEVPAGVYAVTHIFPSGEEVTANSTYTLTVTDSTGSVIAKQTEVRFVQKIYWGTSASSAITTSSEIIALQNNDFMDIKSGDPYDRKFTFDASGGRYIYFAIPKAFGIGIDDFMIGNFFNNNWTVTDEFDFTNESGETQKYMIFKLNDLQHAADIEVRILHGANERCD